LKEFAFDNSSPLRDQPIVLSVVLDSTLVVLAQDTHHKKTEAVVEDRIHAAHAVAVQNDIPHNVLSQY